ncbi:MAG TPA: SIMPL domain-containing protein [Methanocella sp.]|uniref:SIMPL domain-containing protein n=1 Tax=Methanocella sp. TaxID=2052833 RepID=UPI002C7D6DF7|nr:SIMPL domain-containing protein [Methanocella sp.]HTY91902.1 SIMPL domain-containing protein [Methanocella sp.]
MGYKKGLLFGLGAIAALAIILAIMGSASADDTPLAASKDKTVSVTGTGSVYATPDIAKFSTGVVTEADTSADAMQKNAQLMDSVVSAIKRAGIPDKDIRTGRISLEPVYNYYSQPSGSTEKPKIVGYSATNTVTVTIRDLSKVGATIDAATNAGANKVNGVSFELSDELASSVYKQALTKAVADGVDKAKTIGDAAGTGSLALKSITESGTYYPQPVYMDFAASGDVKAAAVPTPVSPGEQKIQATVTMVYTFV